MMSIKDLIDKAVFNKDEDPYDEYGNPLFEMANLGNNKTGLSNQNLIIYISTKQGTHGPRVKVFKKGQAGRNKPCISFSIKKEPEILDIHNFELSKKDISEIKYWISINHVLLLKLWYSLDWENVEISDYLDNLDKI